MHNASPSDPAGYRVFTRGDIDRIPQFQQLDKDFLLDIKAVAAVLPFRVNNYVLEHLIDWDRLPDDPIFQLTVPQPGMLEPADLAKMKDLIDRGADRRAMQAESRRIQRALNPHPGGQLELNVPKLEGGKVAGVQHKYRETVLFFPSHGQTCHAYCTYCFRWAQFVGMSDLKFAGRDAGSLVEYLRHHPEVTDVLFTGGDPLVMKTKVLRRYIEPLLDADLPNLRNLRIGTKAPAYWPQRFVSDDDADDLLRLFESIVARGVHLSVMAHYSHSRELDPPIAQRALRRVLATGAVVRCQAPVVRHVNDNARVWSDMWRAQVALGAVPYYMFVERDTGPKEYFKVPLGEALNIFDRAFSSLSGLARTVRGPSMSATPGKILVDGICELGGERYFVLKFIQARDPDWVNRVFFAPFDSGAAWIDDLAPAFGERTFFYEDAMRRLGEGGQTPVATGEPTTLVMVG